MLQETGHDSADYVGCIRFFWSALLEYQKGCCYGLRPLKLLESLMRRHKSVTEGIKAKGPLSTWPGPVGESIYFPTLLDG